MLSLSKWVEILILVLLNVFSIFQIQGILMFYKCKVEEIFKIKSTLSFKSTIF